MTRDRNQSEIQYCCYQCDKHFGECFEKFGSPKLQELGRDFTEWTRHLGVFARPGASLDNRLQSAPSLAESLSEVVRALDERLTGSKYCPLFYTHVIERGLSVKLSQAVLHISGPASTLMADSYLEQPLQDVSEILDWLRRFRLILRSPVRDPLSRAAGFQEFYKSGEERFDWLEAYDEFVDKVLEYRYRELDPKIRKRLAQAVCLRRRHFMYVRNHQLKLGAHHQNLPISELSAASSDAMKTSEANPTARSTSGAPKSVALSSTNVSYIPLDRKVTSKDSIPLHQTPSVAKTASIAVQPDRTSIPPPPILEPGKKEQQCPYCYSYYRVDKNRDKQRLSWEEHVKKDLKPYLCIKANCEFPDEYYSSFTSWRNHMEQDHEMEWICLLHDKTPQDSGSKDGQPIPGLSKDNHTFAAEVEFKEHLSHEHFQKMKPEQISAISRGSKRVKAPETSYSTCPFCPCTISSEPYKHIARHLLDIALISLPPREDDAMDNQEVNSAATWDKESAQVDQAPSNTLTEMVTTGTDTDPDTKDSTIEAQEQSATSATEPKSWNFSNELSKKRQLDADDRIKDWISLEADSEAADLESTQDMTLRADVGASFENIEFVATDDVQILQRGYRTWTESPEPMDYAPTDQNEYSPLTKTTEELPEAIEMALVEWPPDDDQWYAPQAEKDRLATVSVVAREIQVKHPSLRQTDIQAKTLRVVRSASNLFLILAYIGRGGHIVSFLDEGISDEDLPFDKIRSSLRTEVSLQLKGGRKIASFESWNRADIRKFYENQWCMISPVFEKMRHYVLDNKVVLPFTPIFDKNRGRHTSVRGSGGYSQVHVLRIHRKNHRFGPDLVSPNEDPKVAIKQLLSEEQIDFERERDILVTLGSRREPHPHLIRLLASYEYHGKYHLMFPCADSNLRSYWETRPYPSFDRHTVLWSLNQMAGIADALSTIHNFNVTMGVGNPGKHRDEMLYGRHGDVKPENILWFSQVPDGQDYRGVLQITDLGHGRFHGRHSRTKPFYNISTSPTYQPPEHKLRKSVSRKIDVWSLGCLYLEFVTWILEGSNQIEGFSEERGDGKINTDGISDDNFFSTTHDGVLDAIVRPEVVDWSAKLHQNTKCSQAIHQVIDLVMRKQLVVAAADRAAMAEVTHDLKSIVKQAEADDEFLLKPTPYKPSPVSTPPKPRPSRSEKVQFLEPDPPTTRLD